MVTGAILAGGRSRRLGRDKAGTLLRGKPLALWVAAALAPVVQETLLISNYPLQHGKLEFPLVSDLIPGLGAMGGLLTALFYARTPRVVLAPCDTPFLQPDLLRRMLAAASRHKVEAVVCHSRKGLEPLPAVYQTRLFSRLATHLKSGDYRLRSFLAACRTVQLTPGDITGVDPEEHSFFNINTPEDLEQAERLAASLPALAPPEISFAVLTE